MASRTEDAIRLLADSCSADTKQTQSYKNNCFPAKTKSLLNASDTGAGAWLVEQKAEDHRIKALANAKLRTFEQIRVLRQKAEKNGTTINAATASSDDIEEDLVLDGYFLLKCCAAQDPGDLCIGNISGQGLTEIKPADFLLFDNVTFIDASENLLPLEPFSCFPALKKLEIAVNGIRGLQLTADHFSCLQDLNISYNNLSASDVLNLGLLPKLCVLNISGNNLTSLLEDMSHPLTMEKIKRFVSLEKLIADNNKLTETGVFTAVAGLNRLQLLSLANNQITKIPHLLLVEGKYVIIEEAERQLATNGQKIHKKLEHTSNALVRNVKDDDFFDFHLKESQSQLTGFNNVNESLSRRNASSSVLSYPTSLSSPFSNLVCLNLAYNEITEEKSLLSVASWPKFARLIIHNNPLTMKSKGELPVLKKLLVDRFGILVERRKAEEEVEKPQIIMVDASKKIKTDIPVIPRCKLNDFPLLLESFKKQDTVMQQLSSASISSSAKLLPLPCIRQRGNCIAIDSRNSSELDNVLKEIKSDFKKSHLTGTVGDTLTETSHDPIFMTEMINDIPIDELSEEIKDCELEFSDAKETEFYNNNSMQIGATEELKEFYRKYEGYEELLNMDEADQEDFLPPSYDVCGNVRALRHILNHPLIFGSSEATCSKKQKPFRWITKRNEFALKPRQTRNNKAVAALENLKLRPSVIDASLTDVYSKNSYWKEFVDAKQLLAKVQHRYDDVQTTSVTDEVGFGVNERNVRPLLNRSDKIGTH